MWEQYESPEEKREKAEQVPAFEPAGAPIRAGGSRSGAGVVVGLVAFMVAAGVAVGIAGSAEQQSVEPDYSGFYDCVAEEQADGDSGLLSPADLCEIGNERPPDYVDEYDPTWDDGFLDGSY